MPRYYFDIQDKTGLTRDDVGMELPSMDDAVVEARRTLGGMIKDAMADTDQDQIEICIRDGAEGPMVLTLTLSTASLAE